jgi:multiple sugar transport system permease protein
MATESAVAERATTKTRTKAPKAKKEGTPWWMWLAVAAIVVFCLFPFYWLVSLSLKTRSSRCSRRPWR